MFKLFTNQSQNFKMCLCSVLDKISPLEILKAKQICGHILLWFRTSLSFILNFPIMYKSAWIPLSL